MQRRDAETPREDGITERIIGSAIEVHRILGPGLLESAYEECLCYELSAGGLNFTRQVPLPVAYKGIRLACGYRMDLVVEDLIIVEIETVETILRVHSAQLLSYLRISGKAVGLLINFNAPTLTAGLRRIVNKFPDFPAARRLGVEGDDALPSAEEVDATRLLDPATLVVDGLVAGLHRSPDFGFNQELAEYRDYSPGARSFGVALKRIVNKFPQFSMSRRLGVEGDALPVEASPLPIAEEVDATALP